MNWSTGESYKWTVSQKRWDLLPTAADADRPWEAAVLWRSWSSSFLGLAWLPQKEQSGLEGSIKFYTRKLVRGQLCEMSSICPIVSDHLIPQALAGIPPSILFQCVHLIKAADWMKEQACSLPYWTAVGPDWWRLCTGLYEGDTGVCAHACMKKTQACTSQFC